MASSIGNRSGFRQKSIGRGINEGYTELLANRYFPDDNDKYSYSYQYLTFIAKKLEIIVGREKMGSLYLNANLYGLIEELKKYSNEEDIMRFIANTDFLLSCLKYKKMNIIEKNY